MNKMRLYTPGPTSVPEDVLLEMAKPVFHHRTQQYKDLFAKVNELLKYTFQTKNPVLTISGSGTAGAEMAMINSIPANGTVLFLSNGKFAERWVKIGERNKWNATVLKADYGTAVSPDQVADALKQKHYDAVVLVHSETSACTVTDLPAIAALTRNTDTVLISDGITAIGALPVKTDEWGVDIVITGSQKALMLPPGLAFISVSEKAQKRAAAVKQPNLYLDVNSYLKSYEANDVPWTPAVTLVRGLYVALNMIREEGIENVWKRTSIYAAATRAAANALGLGTFSKQPSDSVTGVNYPAGFTDKEFRGALRKQLNMNIAAGQGTMEGKIFRISHMGYVDQVDTLGIIHGLEIILKQQGYKFEFGAGVAAAHKELAKLQEK
ncbi:MAG TPA: alanine--glyoxylate aminotransferase family protein [Phycisphaerae bacterium]|nr:alanine--glyoxylate aminotransferase family protein [Phycisphaerae bacterium]